MMSTGLPGKIFEELRNDIIHEVYPIGSKLPPERELANKYKASRFAVREAIARLAQNGFVTTQPQSGTFVKDFIREGTLESLVQTLRIRRAIDRQTLDSLLKYRFNTETNAAAEAARKIKDKDINYLAHNLNTKKNNLDNITSLTDCDYDFHFKIITISENTINRLIFQSFKPIYSFFTEFFYSQPGAPETSLKLNWKLLDAFKRREALPANRAMADILKYGEKKVYEAINEGDQLILIRNSSTSPGKENTTG